MKIMKPLILVSILSSALFSSDLVDIRKEYDETRRALEYLIVDFKAIQKEMLSLNSDMQKYKKIELMSRVDILENKVSKLSNDKMQLDSNISDTYRNPTSIDGEVNIVIKSRAISYVDTLEQPSNAVDLFLPGEHLIAENITKQTPEWLCLKISKQQQCFKKTDVEISKKDQ